MKKNQRNNPGTASGTRRTRSQNKTSNRPTVKTETISRFFTKVDKEEDNPNQNQSMYKDVITEIGETHPHNCSNSSDSDFVTLKPSVSIVKPLKVAKIFTNVQEANKRVTRSSKGKTTKNVASKNSKRVVINEELKLIHIGKTSDVNMEHLQLAMALSKSMEPELAGIDNDLEVENIYPSTQQITENARNQLLEYKIKSGLGPSEGSNNIIIKTNITRKKSKFRYIKPKLFTISNENRQKIIEEKIALILSHSLEEHKSQREMNAIHSNVLKEIINEERKIFCLSGQIEKEMDFYYVHALNLEKTEAVCGCLLKNWDLMTGREKSPIKEEIIKNPIKVQSSLTRKNEKCLEEANFDDKIGEIMKHDSISSVCSASQGTFKTARSCSSYFSSVSQCSGKNRIRSISPDLFASSDEEMLEEEVFSTPQMQIENNISDNEVDVEKNKLNYDENEALLKDKSKNKTQLIKENDGNEETPSEGQKYDETYQEITLNLNDIIEIKANEDLNPKNLKNFASASLLSNLNKENLNNSLENFEADNGICSYESFCDYDEHNFNRSVQSISSYDNLKDLPIINNSNKAEIPEKTESCSVKTPNEDKLLTTDNPSTSAGNNSLQNDSINSDFGQSFTALNFTTHVQALLNSETFANDYKSICVEKYIDLPHPIDTESAQKEDTLQRQGDSSIEQRNEDFQDEITDYQDTTELKHVNVALPKSAPEPDADFIDLSQEKTASHVEQDKNEECIDLSQDSDNENYEKLPANHPKSSSNNEVSFQRHLSSKSLDSSTSANESICISDEELNYSCLNSTPKPETKKSWKFEKLAYKKNKFEISDSEDDESYTNINKNCGNNFDKELEESINVTKLLEDLQRKNQVVVDTEPENDENDFELQEALRLSLIEAENDEKRRQSQEIERNQSPKLKTQETADIQNEFADSFPAFNTETEINHVYDKFDKSKEEEPNKIDECQVVDGFSDSFPSFNDEIVNNKPNKGNTSSFIEINDDDELEINLKQVELNRMSEQRHENNFDHSFPSFDHDNFGHHYYEANYSVEQNKSNDITDKTEIILREKAKSDDYEVPTAFADSFSFSDNYNDDKQNENQQNTNKSAQKDMENHPNERISLDNETNDPFDEFDMLVAENQSVFDKNVKPQNRRVQELIGNKSTNKSSTSALNSTNKIASGAFEDTFANLLEQSNVLQNLDQIESTKNQGNPTNSNEIIKTPPQQKTKHAGTSSEATPRTPADGIYVKTSNITPMPLYDEMTTPEIHKELQKIGVKRMKRKRGVQMLKHVYNSMHLPLQQHSVTSDTPNHPGFNNFNKDKPDVDEEELMRPNKRRKKLNYESQDVGAVNVHHLQSVRKVPSFQEGNQGNIEINRKISECETVEEMIFERKPSKRIKSCALPFHIAWHNFLCVNRDIWENVLMYEPLQVEVLYAMFKDLGFKYHIQDMITFFDKKCITIRIKQNN